MKLVTFSHKGRVRVGDLVGDEVVQLAIQDGMDAVLRRGVTPSHTSERFPIDEVEILAPYRPGKIIAVGRNYAEHAAEMQHDLPEKPLLFAKMTSSVIGTGEPIVYDPEVTTQVDWEGELGVVIGRRASRVSEEDALNYVFGYTIANDVSARDLQNAEPQWLRAKGMDTFCPLGPCIVTRREIEDPQALTIVTKVDDDEVQNGPTSDMIFKIPYLIHYISQTFTLEPGDLILTGTPSGVGGGMEPPRFLQDGETVTVTIEGIGTLTNPVQTRKSE